MSEQVPQKIPPQFRQWCLRFVKLNRTSHLRHAFTSLFGTHLTRLTGAMFSLDGEVRKRCDFFLLEEGRSPRGTIFICALKLLLLRFPKGKYNISPPRQVSLRWLKNGDGLTKGCRYNQTIFCFQRNYWRHSRSWVCWGGSETHHRDKFGCVRGDECCDSAFFQVPVVLRKIRFSQMVPCFLRPVDALVACFVNKIR